MTQVPRWRLVASTILTSTLLLVSAATRSHAAPIVYDFTVSFTGGLTGDGSFSVDGDDCPGGVCDGVFTPLDAARTLLSLDVTIDGIAFDVTDSTSAVPAVGFSAGTVSAIVYRTDLNSFPFLALTLDSGLNIVQFSTPTGVPNVGQIVDIEQQSVAEPVSMTLLGLGVAGAAMRRRFGNYNRARRTIDQAMAAFRMQPR